MPRKNAPKSRPRRWEEAASAMVAALDILDEILGETEDGEHILADKREEAEKAVSAFNNALGELRSVQEDYESWKDGVPENLQSGAMYEKLETVCDLNLDCEISLDEDGRISDMDAARQVADEAESMELPRGFGKD